MNPAQPGASWPLLQLPGSALRTLVAHLAKEDRCSMRLACRATQELVDHCFDCLNLWSDSIRGCSWSLQQRFPAVTTLWLTGYVCTERHAQLCTDVARLLQGGAPGLVDVQLDGVPADAISAFANSCPNIRSLKIIAMDTSGADAREPADTVRSICAHLPGLRRLTFRASKYSLCDASMQALAALPCLDSLVAELGEPSTEGWAAFLQLTRLTALHVWGALGSLPPGVHLDLRDMPLAELSIAADRPDWPAPGAELQPSSLYQELCLPGSLVSLELQQLPGRALPQLGSLTQLRLGCATVTDSQMAHLAHSCPALAELHVLNLAVGEAAHAAPLQAVQELEVYGSCSATARARFALVFPQLENLLLNCTCDFAEGGAVFAGASLLTHLGIGQLADKPWLNMQLQDFVALAQLPSLASLCIIATPAHVQGVALCSNLHDVHWVINVAEHAGFEELHAAFTTCTLPAFCTSLSFEFVNDDAGGLGHLPGHCVLVSLADAAMLQAVYAPSVTQVMCSSEHGGFACMTATRLACAALSASIKHIDVWPAGCDVEALQKAAAVLHSRHGITLKFD